MPPYQSQRSSGRSRKLALGVQFRPAVMACTVPASPEGSGSGISAGQTAESQTAELGALVVDEHVVTQARLPAVVDGVEQVLREAPEIGRSPCRSIVLLPAGVPLRDGLPLLVEVVGQVRAEVGARRINGRIRGVGSRPPVMMAKLRAYFLSFGV